MNLEEFETIVSQTIKYLPEEFKSQLDNVDVVIEMWPSKSELNNIHLKNGKNLFGLYRGVPKTKRGSYYSSLPDKITIFAGPILSRGGKKETVRKQIEKTVWHEIGHHFGMNENEIQAAERRRYG